MGKERSEGNQRKGTEIGRERRERPKGNGGTNEGLARAQKRNIDR